MICRFIGLYDLNIRECYKDEKKLCKIHQGCYPHNCLEDIKGMKKYKI